MRVIPGLVLFTISVFIFLNTGCLEFMVEPSARIYEAQPVKISYDISYGYMVNCTGTGSYTINYQCDIVDAPRGMIHSIDILYPYYYEDKTMGENQRLSWNITGTNQYTYILGVNASIIQEGIVTSLDSEDALSISDIATHHQEILEQYCRSQTADNICYIDISNRDISDTARSIANQIQDGNAFIIAQELFKWLKTNTRYATHDDNPGMQPAITTYNLRTGDCDDLSLLYITLCRVAGIPARFIRGYMIGTDEYNKAYATPHAWVEVFVGIGPTGWIPVECAGSSSDIQVEVDQHFGVEDVFHLRGFVDTGSNESLSLMLNDISFTYTHGVSIKPEPFIKIQNFTILESRQLVVTKDKHRYYR